MATIITWSPEMACFGDAVVAIGVFDGVHLGHQSLLRDTVADAAARGVSAVAITFDRDPDQIVAPDSAAPQLLTLADKLQFMCETELDAVLVIPFTAALGEMSPEAFLDSVLAGAVRPVCVHVGRDFRFGARATGDVTTMLRLGLTRGFEVVAHELIASEGAAVTSTRIRALVASGDVVTAAELLTRPARVSGIVHRGRGEGAALGFPTANVVPVTFAALPADGVYAGRAILENGDVWACAISVGTPPSFPEARDYLEAHLIGFDGDLYNQPIALEFLQWLRDQRPFDSLDELTRAIAGDVDTTREIAGFDGEQRSDDADAPAIEDPALLESAEQAARAQPAHGADEVDWDSWTPLLSDQPCDLARLLGFQLVLEAIGIPVRWDPFPPAEIPLLKRSFFRSDRFTIAVPHDRLDEARDLIETQDTNS